MSETSSIVRPSIEAIRQLGIPCERIQTGTIPLRGGRFLHCADPGTADIWTALGWLEGKVPGGYTKKKTADAQRAWRERARAWGVRVEQTESIEQTIAIVKRWLAEYEHEKAMGWR